jgi:2-C-methyl-D-erythritol 4-phosphate cytidylyltransferase
MNMETQIFHDISILIPAAGLGTRLGLGPKALIELDGKPLIYWLAEKTKKISSDIIVAAPRSHIEDIENLHLGVTVIKGGSTREKSIEQLILQSKKNHVAIIPVAFPFASSALIRQVILKGMETGAAAAYLHPNTPVSVIYNGQALKEFWCDDIGIFQAPQCYHKDVIITALSQRKGNKQSTVCKVIAQGKAVSVVDGEKTNIKITDSVDWLFAQSLKTHLV